MNLSEHLSNGYKKVWPISWIIVIPLLIDLASLFANSYFLKQTYYGMDKIFTIKFGLISAPPSAKYLLENFPSILYSYNTQYGVTGIITQLNPFNFFLILSVILITAFLNSAYMGCLEKVGRNQVHLQDLFILGNKNWYKYFILDLLTAIPLFFILADVIELGFAIFITPLFVILFYVQHSIVIDDIPLKQNFAKGIKVFFNNFGLTLKMAIWYGIIISLTSLLIFPLSRMGTYGIIIAVAIIDFLGLGVNKAVLEVYRELAAEYDERSVGENVDEVG